MKYLKLFSILILLLLTSSIFSQKIKVIEINNLDLNSQYAEIGIKYLKNQRVLFASSKKVNADNKRDKRNNRHMGLRLYTGSINNNGNIANVQLFSNAENNPINESNITFTSDYKTVYFTRNNYIQDDYRKQFKKDTLDSHILKLFKASLNSDGSLSNIEPLPINNASYSVTNPQLSPDNKKLYFISDMKGSLGDFDIYEMDIHADGTYGTPKNLGNKVNSKGTEMFPYVTQDNILYYASNGRGGLGDLDIYSYSLNDTDAKSVNLGKPINSSRDDFSFIFNTNNFMGYFASNRKGGNGDADLYSFIAEPPADAIEEPVSNNSEVVAIIKDLNSLTDANTLETNEADADIESNTTANNPETIDTNQIDENVKSSKNTTVKEPLKTTESAKSAETSNESNSSIASVSHETSDDNNEESIVLNNKEAIPPVLSISDDTNSKTTEETILTNDINSNKTTNTSIANSSTIQEKTPLEFNSNSDNSKINANSITKTSTALVVNSSEKLGHQEDMPIEVIETAFNTNSIEENELVVFKKEDNISEVIQDTIINTPTDSILNQSKTASVTPVVLDEEKVEEECIQIVEGYVRNNSNTVLTNAKLTLYENGENVGTYDISPEGKYSLKLKCNFHYRVTARLNNFEETYFELRTNGFTGTKTTTNIVLEKIPCDILIAGVFRDLNTNLPIPDAKLYLIHNDQQVSQTATKKDGSYSFNAQCDEAYQINTDKFGYEEGLFNISQSSAKNTTIKFHGILIPLPCLQVLNGRVTDINTGEPIINAKVDLFNINGTLKETALSNTNGNFHFTINCEESYKLNTSYRNFEPSNAEFKATSISKQVHRLDMPLKPLDCEQSISGIVLNSRTKTPMTNVEIVLLKDGVVVQTKAASNAGVFSFDIQCESNYSIKASATDFTTSSLEFTSNNIRNEKVDVTLRLESKLDYELVRGEMMILIDPIEFDLDESEIKEDAAIQLTRIVNAMLKNPNISVDIGVHTDSRAPDNYNLTLSQQRAQSIKSYIISKGIAANRLTGKGYGETQLLNKCANGVRCTEAEHLENQRIEFKVNQ